MRAPAPAPTIALPRIAGGKIEPDQRSDPGAGPGAVLGRLLGLGHPDLAVLLLADHRGVEGPDRPGGVEVEHGLIVGLGVSDLVVDGGVEKHGSVGHAASFIGADSGIHCVPSRVIEHRPHRMIRPDLIRSGRRSAGALTRTVGPKDHRMHACRRTDAQQVRARRRPVDALARRATAHPGVPAHRLVARHGPRLPGGRRDPSRRQHRRLLGRAARRGDRGGAERGHPARAGRAAAAAHARPRLPARPVRGRRHPPAHRRPDRRGAHRRRLRLGPADLARRRGGERRARRAPRLGRHVRRSGSRSASRAG